MVTTHLLQGLLNGERKTRSKNPKLENCTKAFKRAAPENELENRVPDSNWYVVVGSEHVCSSRKSLNPQPAGLYAAKPVGASSAVRGPLVVPVPARVYKLDARPIGFQPSTTLTHAQRCTGFAKRYQMIAIHTRAKATQNQVLE